MRYLCNHLANGQIPLKPIGLVGNCRYDRHVARFPRPSFPESVDEVSARLVGLGVVVQAGVFLWLRSPISLAILAFGFAARVYSGPRFSPLGLLVTRVLRPRLTQVAAKIVPGPPKRFAQGVGLVFSGGALLSIVLGAPAVAVVLISMLMFAASLEAFAGLCLGCVAFRWLMKAGVIPSTVCAACNDITAHLAARAASLAQQ
jgi:hypothetical protein